MSDMDIGIYSSPRREDAPLTPASIRERWDRSQRATRRVRELAAVNHAFLQSQMWLFWNRQTSRLEELPREPSRVRASVARVGPDSRRIIAKLMRRELVFDVPP